MSKWISVEDEPVPKDGGDYLVHDNDAPGLPSGRADECAAYNTAVSSWWGDNEHDGEWICYMDMIQDPALPFVPTHWMPLPEPPEDK